MIFDMGSVVYIRRMGIKREAAAAALCIAALGGIARADEASWSRLMDQARTAADRQDFVSAEKALREAELDARRTYGEDSLQVARTRLALSRALIELFRLYEAAAPARAAYDKFSSMLGPESADTLRAKKNLAYVVSNIEEKPDEGERLYIELIETWTRLAGATSAEVIENLDYLGLAQAKQRRWYEAEATLAKALAAARETYGPASAAAARTRIDLGLVIERQGRRGRLAEAASNYRAALEINRQLYGEKDPRVVESLDRLAQVTYLLGNRHEAIGMAREAVEIRSDK